MQEAHPAVAIYRAIQTRPESEAIEIYRRIRAGADPETVMRQITTADLLLQVHLVPESRYRYEFPYLSQLPAYLRSPNNEFLKSSVYEWSGSDKTRPPQPRPLTPNDEKFKAHYLKPFHAATIVDARLAEIVPSRYTTVHADDVLMRTLLHAYFLQEYDWFTFFQKDHFLDDMIAGTGTFCSPLLVNAVLTVGCHCHTGLPHRTELWNPGSLSYQFLAEAKRLWEIEILQQRTLTTLQASLVINSIFNVCGMDKLASAYLVQATDIAHDLGLFDAWTIIENQRLRQSYDLTAWALFHWQCFLSYQFMTVPLLKTPPKTALPDPSHDPDWYGEIWLKYPSTEVLVPMQYRYVFKAKCDFSIILNNAITRACKADDKNDLVQRGAKQVGNVLKDLKVWYETLPDLLAPSNVVFPSQLKVHLQYYYVLIQLYELLAEEQNVGSPSIPLERNDLQISLSECRAFFETILRVYYLRHSFEHGNMMLPRYLAMLAFMAFGKLENLTTSNSPSLPMDIGDADPEAAKSTFIMAQKGLTEQGKSYYVPQTMSNTVLTEDSYPSQGHTNVEQEGEAEAKKREEHMEGQCPLDVLDISKNPEQHQSENWIRRYAKVNA